MRSLSRFSFVLLVGAALIGGCKSNSTSADSTTNNNNNGGNNNGGNTNTVGMTATVNGKAWTGQVVGFRHAPGLNDVQFEGWVNTPFQQIPIVLSPDIYTTGTYPFVRDVPQSGQLANTAFNTMTGSYSDILQGSITVTAFTNTNIQGTFYFSARSGMGDTVVITNGKFNVPLQ